VTPKEAIKELGDVEDPEVGNEGDVKRRHEALDLAIKALGAVTKESLTLECPYCGQEWEEDPDLLRIYLGAGEGHCYECDRDFDIEATKVICIPQED
jgi:hypothetical protein